MIKKTDVSLGLGHMILQTFQGYLYIISKSVWKVRDYKEIYLFHCHLG